MRSLNRVFLIGHVGRDPDIRDINNNRRVANFSMATNEVWRDASGQTQQRTEWHRIVAFGNLAEIAQRMIRKGRYIMVEGRIQSRQYTDNSGQNKTVTEIVARNILILEPKGSGYDVEPGSVEPPPVFEPMDSTESPEGDDTDLDFLL